MMCGSEGFAKTAVVKCWDPEPGLASLKCCKMYGGESFAIAGRGLSDIAK